MKFQKKDAYWETFEYKYSDLTTFLGLPWDFVRENAMLDYMGNPKAEDYMKKYWSAFTKLLANDHKEKVELLQ